VGYFVGPGIDTCTMNLGFTSDSKNEAVEVKWLAQGQKRGGPWRVLSPCSDH
jgi:hypothetical protein